MKVLFTVHRPRSDTSCGIGVVKFSSDIPSRVFVNVWVTRTTPVLLADTKSEPVTLTPLRRLTLTWRRSPGPHEGVGVPPRVVSTSAPRLIELALMLTPACFIPVGILSETRCELVQKKNDGQSPSKMGEAGAVVGKIMVPFCVILTVVYEFG